MKYLIILLLSFSSVGYTAEFQLVLHPNQSKKIQDSQLLNKIQAELKAVEQLVPPQLKQKLKHGFNVSFDLQTKNPLRAFDCTSDYLMTEKDVERAKEQWTEAASKYNPSIRYNQVIESYVEKSSKELTNHIHLNAQFLQVLAGQLNSAYNCEHRNFQRLLRANIIHSIGYFYDQKISATQDLAYNQIAEFKQSGNSSETIKKYFPRDEHPFANIESARNHFAYNLEFFLLDPEYQCRKPSLNRWFSRHFQLPSLAGSCRINTKVRLVSTGAELVDPATCPIPMQSGTCPVENFYKFIYDTYDLNPEDVYGIEYVKAAPGEGIASKFGHSAFRVKVCKGFHTHHDPKRCEKGMVNGKPVRRWGLDLVFSYVANTMGLQINNWRGLKGEYPLQLMFYPVNEYMDQYGVDELRHVYTFPIQYGELAKNSNAEISAEDAKKLDAIPFDPEKIKNFVYYGLERYWTYNGHYAFLSRNCADEALEHMKATMDNPEMYRMSVMLPGKVDKKLGKIDFLDCDVVNQKKLKSKIKSWEDFQKNEKAALNNDHVFASIKFDVIKGLKFLLDNLDEKLKSPNDYEDELEKWIRAGEDFKPDSKDQPLFIRLAEKLNAAIAKIPPEQTSDGIKHHIRDFFAVKERLKANPKDPIALGEYLGLSAKSLVVAMYVRYGDVSRDERLLMSQNLYRLFRHVHKQVARSLNEQSMRLACKIIDCDDAEKKGRKSADTIQTVQQQIQLLSYEEAEGLRKDKKELKEALEKYAKEFYLVQEAQRPFREYTTASGYGIPLESDVLDERDERLKNLKYYLLVAQMNIYRLLRPELGIVYSYEDVLKHTRANLYYILTEEIKSAGADVIE